jgi:HD-like signal output (HDOD) protein/ActR/RegA family two-component response regulator
MAAGPNAFLGDSVPTPAVRDRVLFVDDEPHLLAALRRMLRPERDRWDVLFASSGAEALAIFAEQPVDAIVSDMRMPGMTGAELLAVVQRDHPATARIILSGQADRASVIEAIRSAQQFLAKPCDAETLTGAVTRALAVRRRLVDPALRELIGGVSTLPILPAIYHQLVAAMAEPEVDLASIATILAGDVATSAEVLKLVNSAFFGLTRTIPTVESAVSLLGLDNIQALVVTGSVFRMSDSPVAEVDVEELRELALRRAAIGRRVSALEGWPQHETNPAVLACMLRDVGALVLAEGRPVAHRELIARLKDEGGAGCGGVDPVRKAELECELYGCTAPEAGAYLLGLWNFPDVIVHAVASQPLPEAGPGVGPMVHLLNFAQLRALDAERPAAPPLDGYLTAERLLSWNAAADQVLVPA